MELKYSFIDKNNPAGYIQIASRAKRCFAGVLDFFIFFIFAFLSFLGLNKLFLNSEAVENIRNDYNEILNSSGLFNKIDEEYDLKYFDTYEEYQDLFVEFYTVNLNNFDNSKDNKDIYWFNVFMLGQEDEKNIFGSDFKNNRYKIVNDYGNSYFEYKKDSNGNNLVDELCVIKEALYIDGNLPDETKENILKYFYNDSDTENCLYAICCNEVYSFDGYQLKQSEFTKYYFIYPFLISFFSIGAIFYLLIPLLMSDGETIGKKLMGICLLDAHYFKVKKYQIVLRIVLPFVFLVLVYFIIPLSSYILFLLYILVSFLMIIFSKERHSVFDFFGITNVIDKKESIYFINSDEQLEYFNTYTKIIKK